MKILAISGSLRIDSYNRKLLQNSINIAFNLGHETYEIDLKEKEFPVYDADIELNGIPPAVRESKVLIDNCDLIMIAAPEYNYSVSGALKNALDWFSRDINSLDGKVSIIFGASTSEFGTVRAQIELRRILQSLNVLVVPQPEVFIADANFAFTDRGDLINQEKYNQLEELIVKGIEYAEKLK